MKYPQNIPLVKTIKERCRVCYTCVRECPAKAIRIADGQAEVIAERCIGCGNCVRVCSQHAKEVLSAIDRVEELLASGATVAACLAPSFPAEFPECDHPQLAGMLRAMGFAYVNEVSFGADLVAREYQERVNAAAGERTIATTCPAIVGFVERYYPEMVPFLSPVVSPMLATARVLHALHGPSLKVVFIGPCIAKKGEAACEAVLGEVDAALTFAELRTMLEKRKIAPGTGRVGDFDPPHGCMGALFPISRGMLQAAGLREDLVEDRVVCAEGRSNFVDALEEFKDGALNVTLLEVLCCNGCIMGAGMTSQAPLLARRSRISQYMRSRLASIDRVRWQGDIDRFRTLNLQRRYQPHDQRIPVPFSDELGAIMARMGKFRPEDELNCGACGYDTCREHAVAIYKGLAESEMCLPHTIEQLRETVKKLEISNLALASTQEALMQSEKLASMGQLAAGIAHEVNNPLGVVLMYAHLLLEECGKQSKMYPDLEMIAQQADRCKAIVSGLLHFARQNKLTLQEVDAAKLVADTLHAYYMPDKVRVKIENRLKNPRTILDRDQILQVLTNLINNAVAAMPGGGTLTVCTDGDDDRVRFTVADTGVGIPRENRTKIFEPFFTTKQIGKGTGLGLAISYGIVKMHRGDIAVTSNADPQAGPTGTTFSVTVPRRPRLDEPMSPASARTPAPEA